MEEIKDLYKELTQYTTSKISHLSLNSILEIQISEDSVVSLNSEKRRSKRSFAIWPLYFSLEEVSCLEPLQYEDEVLLMQAKGINIIGLEEVFNFKDIGSILLLFINQQTLNYCLNKTKSYSILYNDTKDTSRIMPIVNIIYRDSSLNINQTPTSNLFNITLLDHTKTNLILYTMINLNINIDKLIK